MEPNSGIKTWYVVYTFGISYSLVETFDGGRVLAGKTYSFSAGTSDFYLVKTDDKVFQSFNHGLFYHYCQLWLYLLYHLKREFYVNAHKKVNNYLNMTKFPFNFEESLSVWQAPNPSFLPRLLYNHLYLL